MPPNVCDAMHTMLKREKVPSISAVHSWMQPASQQPRMPSSALHASVSKVVRVGRGASDLLLLVLPAAPWLLPSVPAGTRQTRLRLPPLLPAQAVLAILSSVGVVIVLRTLALDAGGAPAECLT